MLVSPPELDAALLGVDLGASGVRVYEAGVGERGRLEILAGPFAREFCGPAGEERGFAPLPLAEQLAALRSGSAPELELGAEERAEGARRAACIAEVLAEAAGPRPLLAALAAPGLRSPDGRGLVAVRNGPRLPRLLAELEVELRARGLALARALPELIGDGEAAGWGELHGRGGAIDAARASFLLVGGSGVAEVWVRAGRARALEQLDPSLPRAWELALEAGAPLAPPGSAASVEDALAPGRWNARWRDAGGTRPLERAAAEGDRLALALQEQATRALAAHLARRAVELASHPMGSWPERIVLGGALARILRREQSWLCALEVALARELATAGAPDLERWLAEGDLRAGRLVLSSLDAAPALGALAARLLSAGRPEAQR